MRLGEGTAPALAAVEQALGGARTGVPAEDIAKLVGALRQGDLLEVVEGAVGSLPSLGGADD